MAARKHHPFQRKSTASLGPTIKAFNFRVQKNVSLPAVERQSMRIAIANSLETDKLHKLANSATDPSNASAKPSLTAGNASSSSPARRTMRSANKDAALAMAPPSRGSRMLIANGQHRATAANPGRDAITKAKKADQVKTKSKNQPEVDFSRGIPAGPENYFCIKGVLAEVKRGGATQYLVEWDGTDPSTGMAWPAEWVRSTVLISCFVFFLSTIPILGCICWQLGHN